MTLLRDQLQSALGSDYRIERELGGGGMSRVFVAADIRLGRKVVVKVLSPELAAGVSAERFDREVRVAASLQQANIVPVLSSGESDGIPFFTMPFVDGESLRKRLGGGDALTMSEIVRILGDVARALAYAHAHGVVHRDIKPDNVLLSGGTAVVTDFGIAKALAAARGQRPERAESARDLFASGLTQLGTSLGTPAYMAPEQAAGDPNVDHRADIYAFGCLAYELLAGRPPFEDKLPHRVLAAHMTQAAPPIAEVNPQAPPVLASLVMQCLEKVPDDRPQSAGDLTRVLDSITSGVMTTPTLARGPAMLRRALLIYLGAFIAVGLVTQAAITRLGLPDWVLPGAVIVMLLGLPVILFTAYAERMSHRSDTLGAVVAKAGPLVSWRRTTVGGVVAVSSFAVAVTGFMTMRALGIGPAGSLISSGKLDSREPLLVADFQTGAADTALSRVLAEAMRTNLGESRVVSLVSAGEVAAGLQRMRVPVDTTLSAALARDLAQREGIKAIVAGSVAPLSSGFVISARLIAAQSGEDLASAQETVDGAGDLIAATDRLSRKLRGRIGESLKDVRSDPPLAQVTTSSLEALKKYAEGVRANDVEADYRKAIRLLEEAIAIDSMFGMAYRKLGIAMGNLGGTDPTRRRAVFDKGYQLRDRMTERERLLTTANYFSSGPHPDRGKSIEAYEALLRRYPEDGAATLNLSLALSGRREFARAESLVLRRIELDSTTQFAPFNIIPLQIGMGKLDAARASLTRASRLFPKHYRVQQSEALLHYAAEQIDSTAVVLRAAGSDVARPDRARSLFELSNVRRRQGKLADARLLLMESRRTGAAGSTPATALADSLTLAQEQLWFFDRPNDLLKRVDGALSIVPLASVPSPARPHFELVMLYSAAGRPDRARAVLAQLDAATTDTVARRLGRPERQEMVAWISIAEGRYREAIDTLRASEMLPDGPRHPCTICLDPMIGRAFDLALMPDSAIAAYEHFVNAPMPFRYEIDGWELARISRRLGELYEAKGDRVKAAAYYQKFVDLWKDADPELQPRVAESRQRLARLRDPERPR